MQRNNLVIAWMAGCFLFLTMLGIQAGQAVGAEGEQLRVYLGTYTQGKSQGIYVCELALATGKLTEPRLAAEINNPSFLAIAPGGKYLAAVSEISNLNGKPVGGVSSFAVNPHDGSLKLLSQQPSGGAGPCHVQFDRTGEFVLAANYGGGSCCVHPIDSEGKLAEMSAFQQHQGQGAILPRQSAPHAHSIHVSPDNKYAFCVDLGLDKILIYKLLPHGKLEVNEPAFLSTEPGGGPRHFAFHPNGKFAYCNLEISSSVTALSYNPHHGMFTPLKTLSTLPQPTPGNSTAETQVHPSGKFVYVSNRGHNSIAIFKVMEDGNLEAVGHQGKGIKVPRNFGIDPTGRYALVANQAGDDVLVFNIDQETGMLEPTEFRIEVPAPVCVKFLRKE